MKFFLLIFFVILLCGGVGHAQTTSVCLQKLNQSSTLLIGKIEKQSLGKELIACSQKCLSQDIENVECLYTRGVSQGLLMESGLAQPSTYLPLMVADFNKVKDLDSHLDHGGAARALADLYLQLPAMPILGASWMRDLGKAETLVHQALQADREYWENHFVLAKILKAKGDKKNADKTLKRARRLLRKDTSFSVEQKKNLQKNLLR